MRNSIICLFFLACIISRSFGELILYNEEEFDKLYQKLRSLTERTNATENLGFFGCNDTVNGNDGIQLYILEGGEHVRFGGSRDHIDVLRLTKKLDFDKDNQTINEFRVVLKCNRPNTPNIKIEKTLQIILKDINDNPPVFDRIGNQTYDLEIPEVLSQAGLKFRIPEMRITDADGQSNNQMSVNCTSIVQFPETVETLRCADYFSVESFKFNASDKVALVDLTAVRSAYTEAIRYKLELEAINVPLDTATEPTLKSNPVNMQVTLQEVQNQAPVFVEDPIGLTIFENEPRGTIVGGDLRFIAAADGDDRDPNPLGFQLLPSSRYPQGINFFRLGDVTPPDNAPFGDYRVQLILDQTIDREQDIDTPGKNVYVDILAYEIATPERNPQNKTANITVTIGDVNDNVPTFSFDSYSFALNELEGNVTAGTTVLIPQQGPITVRDNDGNLFNSYTMTILPGQDSDFFTIDPPIGVGTQIFTLSISNSALDYEQYGIDDVILRAILLVSDDNNPAFTSTVPIRVAVVNVNEFTPTFTQNRYDFTVAENRGVDSFIGQVVATDNDGGAFGVIRAYDIDGNVDAFSIDSNGNIFLREELDFEDTTQYSFTVRAFDDADGADQRFGSTLVNIVVENILDTVPQIIGVYRTGVAEDSTELQLDITIRATTIEPTTILFSLSRALPPQVNVNEYFTINPATGKFEMIKPLDFGLTNNGLVQVEVVASLAGNPALQATTFVNITVENLNNFPPVFVPTPVNGFYFKTISEGVARGSVVFNVNTTDADEENTPASDVEYVLISGGNDDFVIDQTTGVLRVGSGSNLDVDEQQVYDIEVRARDFGTPGLDATVTIRITLTDANNKPPIFERALYLFSVNTSATIGTFIGRVNATDPDQNSNIRYSLDYTGDNLLQLNNRPVSVNIDVRNLISIESDTGIIRTAGRITQDTYDRITIFALANDTNGETTQIASASVVISVSGEQDPTILFIDPDWSIANPVIERSFFESDSEDTVGPPFITLTALDPLNSRLISIFREVEGADVLDYFKVNATNIILKKPLDFELLSPDANNRRILTVVVEAISDDLQRTSNATIRIQVNDVNDNPPLFARSQYEATVLENSRNPTTVITISVTDRDSGSNAVSTFTLESDTNDFVLYPSQQLNTAVIGVAENASIDHETSISYDLTLFAVNSNGAIGATNVLQASTQIKVLVQDVNDNAPLFGQRVYEFTVLGTTDVPSIVGEVRATDPDTGRGGRIRYGLDPGTDRDFFTIDTVSTSTARPGVFVEVGVINVTRKLDSFSDGHVFNFTMTAADDDPSFPKVGRATLLITVNRGIRDPNPRWDDGLPTSIAIFENATIGTFVVKLTARPENVSSSIIYSFVTAGDAERDSDLFRINPFNGEIYTDQLFRYDNRITSNNFKDDDGVLYEYYLKILATDASNSSYTSQFLLTVQILDIDNNVPTFRNCTDRTYPDVVTVAVMEEKPAGEPVYTVIGCDDDETPNNIIAYQPYLPTSTQYEALCPNQADLFTNTFTINAQTGLISTRVPLDREEIDTYLLCVQAVIPSQLRSNLRKKRGVAIENRPLIAQLHDVLLVRVNVLDANDNGPVFDRDIVRRVILPYQSPAGGVISRAFASDIDLNPNNQIRYSIENIQYFLSPSSKQVRHLAAFAINVRTGQISNGYPNYQAFVGGYFNLTIKAEDERGENNLFDRQQQLIHVADARNLLRVVIDRPADRVLKEDIERMVRELNELQPGVYYQEMKTSYHIINNEKDPVFERTDVCFVIVRDESVVSREDALDFVETQVQVDALLDSYGAQEPGSCDPAKTVYPQGWESYWWVLVAFAIFIFVCVLILIFIILSLYSGYKRYMDTRRTYLVPN